MKKWTRNRKKKLKKWTKIKRKKLMSLVKKRKLKLTKKIQKSKFIGTPSKTSVTLLKATASAGNHIQLSLKMGGN